MIKTHGEYSRFSSWGIIAVGRPVTRPPPPRSRRAVFPHRALPAYSRPQSSLGTPSGHSRRRPSDDVRALHPDGVPQVSKPGPRIAAPRAATRAPCEPEAPHPGAERLPAGRGPGNAIVVVVAPHLGGQLPEPSLPPGATLRRAPLGHPLERVSPLLARCPALEVGLARPVSPPAKLKAQQVEAGMAGHRLPGEREHPPLVRRPLQPAFAKPLAQRPGEPLRVGLILERAPESIRVANQARFAPTSGRDHAGTPRASASCRDTFARRGERSPPCGVPVTGGRLCPAVSSPPALNPLRISRRKAPSSRRSPPAASASHARCGRRTP
jgi:hypothetical protein